MKKIFDSINNINKINDMAEKLDDISANTDTLLKDKEYILAEIDSLKEEIKTIKSELDLTLIDIVKCSTIIKTHQEAIMKLFEAYAKLIIKKTDTSDEVDKLLYDKPKKNNNNLN